MGAYESFVAPMQVAQTALNALSIAETVRLCFKAQVKSSQNDCVLAYPQEQFVALCFRSTVLVLACLSGQPVFADAQSTCPPGSSRALVNHVFVYPRHEERFAQRLEALQERLKSTRFDVIGIGDSIMQRWPESLLAQMGHGSALDLGIGGDGIPQLLWRLDHTDWSGQKPHDIYVMIGTNDLARGASGCEVVEGVMAVREKLASLFPSSKVHIISILPRGPDLHEYQNEIQLANEELRRRAVKARFDFIDASTAFVKNCGSLQPPITCQYMQGPKNVHPTPAGYQMLFDSLNH